MASRILNRRALRDEADQVAQSAAGPETPVAEALPKKKKAKTPGVPRVRKPRAKKAPPRMCVRWGIFDNVMKQVAIFNYNERGLADQKLADLLIKKQGGYFLQAVKEAMPEPVVAEAAAVE